MPTPVAYNPYDPKQAALLSALALGESGGGISSTFLGTGGYDLHDAPTDPYGFPQWAGFGGSHAAGTYQFQPGTWDPIAAAHGLNFSNPNDQNAAAWYLAQDTYAQKTGGSLSDALNNGDYQSIQTALAGQWPSVNGNGATPGLAATLTSGKGALIPGGGNAISADTTPNPFLHPIQYIASQFQRWGVLIIGALIVLVALYMILADAKVVPTPGQVVKTVGKVAALA